MNYLVKEIINGINMELPYDKRDIDRFFSMNGDFLLHLDYLLNNEMDRYLIEAHLEFLVDNVFSTNNEGMGIEKDFRIYNKKGIIQSDQLLYLIKDWKGKDYPLKTDQNLYGEKTCIEVTTDIHHNIDSLIRELAYINEDMLNTISKSNFTAIEAQNQTVNQTGIDIHFGLGNYEKRVAVATALQGYMPELLILTARNTIDEYRSKRLNMNFSNEFIKKPLTKLENVFDLCYRQSENGYGKWNLVKFSRKGTLELKFLDADVDVQEVEISTVCRIVNTLGNMYDEGELKKNNVSLFLWSFANNSKIHYFVEFPEREEMFNEILNISDVPKEHIEYINQKTGLNSKVVIAINY